jgi:hypothetical protein
MFSEIAGKGRGKLSLPEAIGDEQTKKADKIKDGKTEYKYWDSDTFLYLCC